jgi:transglutaminase-like putative cysteine protease
MTVRYRVEHETRYDYAAPVATSQHVAYLRPRELPYQRVLEHRLEITPEPAESAARVDYFGNAARHFALLKPHVALVTRAVSAVEVLARESPRDPEQSPPWEEARDRHTYVKGRGAHEASPYAFASSYVGLDAELAEFARPSFAPGTPLLAGAIDLMHRIHDEFTFDASATTLTTPVRRVLAERRGVCQDFAHLQIAGLRSLGLAARYVSGYLLTDPPPGQERLAGADASHAWLSVFCPQYGWVDLDPTNDVLPDVRHVTLAWGRDYGDVSPLHGVLLGGADHALHVAVSVVPLGA